MNRYKRMIRARSLACREARVLEQRHRSRDEIFARNGLAFSCYEDLEYAILAGTAAILEAEESEVADKVLIVILESARRRDERLLNALKRATRVANNDTRREAIRRVSAIRGY